MSAATTKIGADTVIEPGPWQPQFDRRTLVFLVALGAVFMAVSSLARGAPGPLTILLNLVALAAGAGLWWQSSRNAPPPGPRLPPDEIAAQQAVLRDEVDTWRRTRRRSQD